GRLLRVSPGGLRPGAGLDRGACLTGPRGVLPRPAGPARRSAPSLRQALQVGAVSRVSSVVIPGRAEIRFGERLIEGPAMHDKFEKLERVGGGAMGTVHRGYDLRLDEPVAIKVMHRPLWLRLRDRDDYWEQLQAAARLSTLRRERDMVRIRDVDRDCGWIVSDLMVGPVRSDGPVQPRVVAGILRQVFQPLGQLHTEYGQLHGAIHPGNLLYDQRGYVRLADPRGFALAQRTPILDLFADLGRSATDADAADGDGT